MAWLTLILFKDYFVLIPDVFLLIWLGTLDIRRFGVNHLLFLLKHLVIFDRGSLLILPIDLIYTKNGGMTTSYFDFPFFWSHYSNFVTVVLLRTQSRKKEKTSQLRTYFYMCERIRKNSRIACLRSLIIFIASLLFWCFLLFFELHFFQYEFSCVWHHVSLWVCGLDLFICFFLILSDFFHFWYWFWFVWKEPNPVIMELTKEAWLVSCQRLFKMYASSEISSLFLETFEIPMCDFFRTLSVPLLCFRMSDKSLHVLSCQCLTESSILIWDDYYMNVLFVLYTDQLLELIMRLTTSNN